MQSAESRKIVRTRAYRAVTGTWIEPVAVACSGGVDSTALLVLAREAMVRGKIAPFVVFHVDHRSRPDTAFEGDTVRGLSRRFGVPFVQLIVEECEDDRGRSREDIWRERRYLELARAAQSMGITRVVTAHNRDDQIETLLMKVFSGSRPVGMRTETPFETSAGHITLLRPLLQMSRRELDLVLDLAQISPILDPTNADTTYRRNAARHDVVPVLQRVFPGFEEAFLRSASLAETDAQYCDRIAAARYADLRLTIPMGITLDRRSIRALDRAIASRVVRLAALELAGTDDRRELSFERIDAVIRASNRRSGALIELPYGIKAQIQRDVIVMTQTEKGMAVD